MRTWSSNRWLEVSTYTRKILRLAKLIQIFLGFLRCELKLSAGKAIQTTAQEMICAGKWACLARCEDYRTANGRSDRSFWRRAQTEKLKEFRVACSKRAHCAYVFGLGSSNSPFITKSFECATFAFLAGSCLLVCGQSYLHCVLLTHLSQYHCQNFAPLRSTNIFIKICFLIRTLPSVRVMRIHTTVVCVQWRGLPLCEVR
jgi:hypothetical protein